LLLYISMIAEPGYRQPQYQQALAIKVPGEWSDIEELATAALPEWHELEIPKSWLTLERLSLTRVLSRRAPHVLELGTMVHSMDPATLEENYFYSARLASCNLLEILKNPALRQNIITLGASIIIAKALESENNLTPFAEREVDPSPSLRQPVKEAFEGLPPAIQFASEIMYGARAHAQAIKAPGRNWDWRIQGRVVRQLARSKEAPLTKDGKHLRGQSLGGASIVVSSALRQDAAFQRTGMPSVELRRRLRHPSLGRMARQAAALHVAVANCSDQLVTSKDDGFQLVPQEPFKPSLSDRVLRRPYREEVLICPAARVPATIEAAVDWVVDMIDESCVRLGEPEVEARIFDHERD
jgi:hypothetical protein